MRVCVSFFIYCAARCRRSVSVFVNFVYFSFITMSTVGYGDITPKIPESQTLAYFISVTGQLYIAIIIAFLVGKSLVHQDRKEEGK